MGVNGKGAVPRVLRRRVGTERVAVGRGGILEQYWNQGGRDCPSFGMKARPLIEAIRSDVTLAVGACGCRWKSHRLLLGLRLGCGLWEEDPVPDHVPVGVRIVVHEPAPVIVHVHGPGLVVLAQHGILQDINACHTKGRVRVVIVTID